MVPPDAGNDIKPIFEIGFFVVIINFSTNRTNNITRLRKIIFFYNIKDIINSRLNIEKEIVYSNVCIIKKVHKEIEMEFLNSYCLQGYTPSNICLGLYYNGELLELQSYKNVNIENDN
jgi:hypothetical protein